MNLWVKRIGQLAMLAVALFFYSCKEDVSTLGYKNPNSKFKVSYVEIPIASSILLRDSLRTTNFSYTGEPNRFLIGQYKDDVFGDITSSIFTQYFAQTPLLKVSSTAVYDSVTLQLQLDLYHYGASAVTPQNISVYELDEGLTSDSILYYTNNSTVAYSTNIGSKEYTIDTGDLDDSATNNADTVITLNVPLNFEFGNRIFNSNVKFRDATTGADSTFARYSEFVKEFKGIAIKTESGDKVVGFNPSAQTTRIIIHYHDANTDSLIFNMGFAGVVGFNQIKSNRIGTELEPVKKYYEDALVENDYRYIQSGIGILTKLDFSKFYEFTDTLPHVLINSAELSIEGVQSSDYAPPALLALRILNESNNRMNKYSTKTAQDAIDLKAYNGFLRLDLGLASAAAVVDNDSVLYANDRLSVLGYSSTDNSYRMVLSLFLQQLAVPSDTKTKFKYFVLHPAAQSTSVPATQTGLKTVNRVVFPKDKIKLKIFYTKPNTPQ